LRRMKFLPSSSMRKISSRRIVRPAFLFSGFSEFLTTVWPEEEEKEGQAEGEEEEERARTEGSEAGAGADAGVGAEGGAEDKAKAEGAEGKAAAETELAVEAETKVEAEARTGAFRLKNIKKMESTTMAVVKTFWPQ